MASLFRRKSDSTSKSQKTLPTRHRSDSADDILNVPVEADGPLGLFQLAVELGSKTSVGAADTNDIEIDFVAVHGLNGHYLNTWTMNSYCWLRDSLPKVFPRCRIFSYGYNSTVVFTQSLAKIDDYAQRLLVDLENNLGRPTGVVQRPICFLCHSMGGIVVKRALILAGQAEQASTSHIHSNIVEMTKAVCFLATPHRGSDAATLGYQLSSIVELAVPGSLRSDLLRVLQSNSTDLANFFTSFRSLAPRFKVASFYELEATLPFKRKIVDSQSATLDFPGEYLIPMNSNHRDICRFLHGSNKELKTILDTLQLILRPSTAKEPVPSPTSEPEHYEINYETSWTFTGRASDIERLNKSLAPNQTVRFGIWGLRGTGKTELAIKYAEEHKTKYTGVFLLNAASLQALECEFDRLSDILGLDDSGNSKQNERPGLVKKWFENSKNQNWLAIFDGANSLQTTNLKNYIPIRNGHVIITSISHQVRSMHLARDGFLLKTLNEDESFQLLKARVIDHEWSQEEEKAAKEIVKHFDGLPLALDSAAAMITSHQITFQEYLRMLQSTSKEKLMRWEELDSRDRPLFASLDISFNSLQDPESRLLAITIAFLGNSSIPLDLFKLGITDAYRPGADGEWIEQTAEEGCVDPDLNSLLEDGFSFNQALTKLMSHSLVSKSSKTSQHLSYELSMHRLVRMHIRTLISHDESERILAVMRVLHLVSQAFPCEFHKKDIARIKPIMKTDAGEYRSLRYSLLPHARTCCENLEDLIQDLKRKKKSIDLKSLFDQGTVGRPGTVSHAVYLFTEATSLQITNYGYDVGEGSWCKRFLNLNDTLLQIESNLYAKTIQLQARITFNYGKGDYLKSSVMARDFFDENCPTWDQGPDSGPLSSDKRANTQLCTTLVWWSEDCTTELDAEGPYEFAKKLLRRCRAVNPEDPSTEENLMLDSRDRIMCKILKDEGNFREAENKFRAYCQNRSIMHDYQMGWATGDWAQVLLELGQNQAAFDVIQNLLQRRRESSEFQQLRPQASSENDTMFLRINLAECHYRLGQLEAAKVEISHLLDLLETDERDHPDSTRMFFLYCLQARILEAEGRWKEAKAVWETAVEFGSRISPRGQDWGRTHFLVAVAIYSLAAVEFNLGNTKSAGRLVLEIEKSGALQRQMYWMLALGTYWLAEVTDFWDKNRAELKELFGL